MIFEFNVDHDFVPGYRKTEMISDKYFPVTTEEWFFV